MCTRDVSRYLLEPCTQSLRSSLWLLTPTDTLSVSPSSRSIPSLGTASSSDIFLLFSQLAPDQIRCVCVHAGQSVFAHNRCAGGAQLLYLSTMGNTQAQTSALPVLRNQGLSCLFEWVKKNLAPTAILISLTLSHGKATSAPCRLFPLLKNCFIWGDLGGSSPCSSYFLAHSFHPNMQRWTM